MTSRCKLNFCRRRGVVDSERSSRNPNTSRRNRHPARISISQSRRLRSCVPPDFGFLAASSVRGRYIVGFARTAARPWNRFTPIFTERGLPTAAISGYLFRGAFASIRSRAYRGTKPPCLSRRASG
ncbi:PREDICTED: uncharacterized protein LOC106741127 isoform X4 [Dinoponera quadriceps]|uniref:Uncharacterized protein LOC106741127 isoform X4 n=1 Tax=Dinoponera quadriceps TaxID=609295 RepID=A0A6P3WQI5_DINQU|nr:PREDICTED: uncharacterized protein LOC106741127 isoform X4 [Dinoponera quadriceps]